VYYRRHVRTLLARRGLLTVALAATALGCPHAPGGPGSARVPALECSPTLAGTWHHETLHVWTTVCDDEAAESSELLELTRRDGVHVDTVGLDCHALRADGDFDVPGDAGRARLLSRLSAQGIATALVVANAAGGDFDGGLAAAVLADPSRSERLLSRLVELQQREQHPIVELDFEAMPSESAKDLVRLVRSLRERLPPAVRVVVDVHAKTVDDPGYPGPGAHDYGELANAGAIVRVMTYDYSIGPVPPGPTTKPSWIREVIAYARDRGVPADRLEIGLPGYGYDFGPGTEQHAPVRWREAESLRARVGAKLLRSEDGTPHFLYDADDGRHQVWFDDGASIAHMLGNLRDLSGSVSGAGIWGVYGADPRVLDAWSCAAR
jgi:spore germination protein YaaH